MLIGMLLKMDHILLLKGNQMCMKEVFTTPWHFFMLKLVTLDFFPYHTQQVYHL
jgi:hypothetical protein